ncbi:unnamed protein product, partial [Urochloa humidicola]
CSFSSPFRLWSENRSAAFRRRPGRRHRHRRRGVTIALALVSAGGGRPYLPFPLASGSSRCRCRCRRRRVMEVLQHMLGRTDDLGDCVPQPGEAGWLPPWLLSSSSSESGLLSSSSSESGKPRPLPPPVCALLQSSSSSESRESGRTSFEDRCIMNLAKSYLPVAPPPEPAQKITDKTHRYIVHAHPRVILEKSKRFAKGALDHYNRRKKIKFELLDASPVIMMTESGRLYTHVNFTARSRKEGSKEQLFFAELYNCGKRRAPCGFVVTCCEPLGSDSTVGHKGFQVDDVSAVRKNVDFTRCFACSPRTLHPRGDKYIAGHCNVPHIYTNTC